MLNDWSFANMPHTPWGAEALSPGLLWTQAARPEGAEAHSPGQRPGLWASAPSGRIGYFQPYRSIFLTRQKSFLINLFAYENILCLAHSFHPSSRRWISESSIGNHRQQCSFCRRTPLRIRHSCQLPQLLAAIAQGRTFRLTKGDLTAEVTSNSGETWQGNLIQSGSLHKGWAWRHYSTIAVQPPPGARCIWNLSSEVTCR